MQYNPGEKTLYLDVPDNLTGNNVYQLNLVAVPQNTGDIDRNVTSTTTSALADTVASTVNLTTQKAEGTITNAEEKTFYTINFRVSQFAKLKDKFNHNLHGELYAFGYSDYYIYGSTDAKEIFDLYETYGHNDHHLISLVANNTKTKWYKNDVEPTIYNDYAPLGADVFTWRNLQKCGLPPKLDNIIYQVNYDHILSDDEIERGYGITTSPIQHFMYKMPHYWLHDHYDLVDYLVNQQINGATLTDKQKSIINQFTFPPPPRGKYYITIKYHLPGKPNVVTTEESIELNQTRQTHL